MTDSKAEELYRRGLREEYEEYGKAVEGLWKRAREIAVLELEMRLKGIEVERRGVVVNTYTGLKRELMNPGEVKRRLEGLEKLVGDIEERVRVIERLVEMGERVQRNGV